MFANRPLNRIHTLREMRDTPGQIVSVDKIATQENPYFLTSDAPNEAVSLAANRTSIQPATVSNEGSIEVTRLAAQYTGAARITISVPDGKQLAQLMNAPIHIQTIFGSAAQPYILPEALYLHDRNGFSISYSDISGSANVIRLNFISAQYTKQLYDTRIERIQGRMRLRERETYPYWYTFNNSFATLAGNGSATESIRINNTGHFLLTHISGLSTGAYSLDILDATKGASILDDSGFSSYQVPNELFVANGNFPYRFEQGLFFEAGSKITIPMTDLSGSENQVNLTLGGIWIAKRMWSA